MLGSIKRIVLGAGTEMLRSTEQIALGYGIEMLRDTAYRVRYRNRTVMGHRKYQVRCPY